MPEKRQGQIFILLLFVCPFKSMKEKYSISKEKTDALQQMFSVFSHYKFTSTCVEEYMIRFVEKEVLPELGLSEEDFKRYNLDVATGALNLNEGEKKENA
jgi:hypothetical protein